MAHLLGGMDFSGIAGAVVSALLYSILARRAEASSPTPLRSTPAPTASQLAHKQHINEEEVHEH